MTEIRILGFTHLNEKFKCEADTTKTYVVDKKIMAEVTDKGEYYELRRPVVIDRDPNDIREIELIHPEEGKRIIKEPVAKATELVVDYTGEVKETIMVRKSNFSGFDLTAREYDSVLEETYTEEFLNVDLHEIPNLPLFQIHLLMNWELKADVYDYLMKSKLKADDYIIISFSNNVNKALRVKEIDEASKSIILVIERSDLDLFKDHNIINMKRKD